MLERDLVNEVEGAGELWRAGHGPSTQQPPSRHGLSPYLKKAWLDQLTVKPGIPWRNCYHELPTYSEQVAWSGTVFARAGMCSVCLADHSLQWFLISLLPQTFTPCQASSQCERLCLIKPTTCCNDAAAYYVADLQSLPSYIAVCERLCLVKLREGLVDYCSRDEVWQQMQQPAYKNVLHHLQQRHSRLYTAVMQQRNRGGGQREPTAAAAAATDAAMNLLGPAQSMC